MEIIAGCLGCVVLAYGVSLFSDLLPARNAVPLWALAVEPCDSEATTVLFPCQRVVV